MFLSKRRNKEEYIDSIFTTIKACREDNDPNKINATVGSLAGEDNKLVAFDTVYDSYNKLDNRVKAKYAQSPMGNDNFNKAMMDFVVEGRIKHVKNIAVAGGTGGLSLGVRLCADEGDTLLGPMIAWGNYKTIAKEMNLNYVPYDIYDLDSLFKLIDEQKDRVLLAINSPCQNPCGLTYTVKDWERIIDKLNNCGKEVVLINDVAYIDYSYDKKVKDYFEVFNHLNDNVLVIIAYSCSKAFSYYGMRLGSAFIIHNDEKFIDYFINQAGQFIRTTYSSVSNSAMENVTDVILNHKEEFLKEKEQYIELLKERSEIFLKEADECGLEYYPYQDGFFVTLKVTDSKSRDEIHERLMKEHIYTIKMNMGIRVGICSVPKAQLKGLAKRIKAQY